jgi:hypothetical protein
MTNGGFTLLSNSPLGNPPGDYCPAGSDRWFTIPRREGRRQEALPKMAGNTFALPDVGHFIEEYKGPEIAKSILAINGPRSLAELCSRESRSTSRLAGTECLRSSRSWRRN